MGGRKQISRSPRADYKHQRNVITCMWWVRTLSKSDLSPVISIWILEKQIEFASFRQGPRKQSEFYINPPLGDTEQEGEERPGEEEDDGGVFVFLSLKNGVSFPRRILSSILATTMRAFHSFYLVFTNTVNHTSLNLLNLPVDFYRFQSWYLFIINPKTDSLERRREDPSIKMLKCLQSARRWDELNLSPPVQISCASHVASIPVRQPSSGNKI